MKLLSKYIVIAVYTYFVLLMFRIFVQYIPPQSDIAFLRIKQDVVTPSFLFAFYMHVFGSIITLVAGFTQFQPKMLKFYPAIHRTIGKLYVASILFIAAPSGFYIGLFANGGISSQIAFCLLALLWFYTTYKAYACIKIKNIKAHKDWMIRSFALTLSAITLRAWKSLLVFLFHPHPMDVYQVVAWLAWVLNLIIAEIIIYKHNTNA